MSLPCGFVPRTGPARRPAARSGPHFAERAAARVVAPVPARSRTGTARRGLAGHGVTHRWTGKPSSASRSTPSSPRAARSSPARATAYGAAPNTQACLVDLGYPGVLPVLNGEAVRMAVRFGLAIGAHGRAPLGVRAQELLLPGPAEGLPDQPVRAARSSHGGTARDRARGRHAASASASPAPTSRRTPASRCTRTSTACRASTSTAPARRCSRSSPSRTCAPRRKPSPT